MASRLYGECPVEEIALWSDEARYLYEERLGILTDGRMHVNALLDSIARRQARRQNVEDISYRWSTGIAAGLHICNGDIACYR